MFISTVLDSSDTPSLPPVNTVAPVISGTQVVGSALSSTTGTWTGTAPISYAYQWYRGASLISGATSSSYTLVQADAGNSSNITCQVTASNGVGTATATSNTLAQIFDSSANSFITTAGITNTTQKNATNQLVLDLKNFSLFGLSNLVVYPMVGGSNSSTSYNLINPALFQISWVGGVVSSTDGVQFNGVNSYGNTGFNPSVHGSQNSHHQGFYSRTNLSAAEIEIGSTDAASGSYVATRFNGTNFFRLNASSDISTANTNSQGFYIGNRTASNVVNGWKNGTKVITGATVSTGNPNAVVFIGAWNNVPNPLIRYYSNKQCAGATIGPGLTDTQAANLRTAMQTFNTTLGRQV